MFLILSETINLTISRSEPMISMSTLHEFWKRVDRRESLMTSRSFHLPIKDFICSRFTSDFNPSAHWAL